MKNRLYLTVAATLMTFVSGLCLAHDRFAEVEIKSTYLAGSVHMLTGSGGNIGVSAGKEGLLIIDDQFAPLAERISNALNEIEQGKLKYVINTHYHGDHTGGNEFMTEVRESTVFAHDNVRVRLAAKDDHVHAELPVVTYAQGVTFHFNGDTIKVTHLAEGHTDGDSVVYFESANVLHTGDLFFNKLFPYIDLGAGGNVNGYIKNVETMLSMINDDTQIIPGHGPLANKGDLKTFVDMIKATQAEVLAMKSAGLSLEKAIEKGLSEQWKSWSWSFIDEKKWISTLYR